MKPIVVKISLVVIFVALVGYLIYFVKKNITKKPISEYLDQALDTLRENENGIDFFKYYTENIECDSTIKKDFEWFRSYLVYTEKAKYINENKDSLRITDSGVVNPKYYTKLRWSRIYAKIVQYAAWYAIIFGIGLTIISIENKKIIKKR